MGQWVRAGYTKSHLNCIQDREVERTYSQKLFSDHHVHVMVHERGCAHTQIRGIKKKKKKSKVVVSQAFNPSAWEAKSGRFLEFEASLVYRVSSSTARATQRNPVSKSKRK
jgi:hypothetical protein